MLACLAAGPPCCWLCTRQVAGFSIWSFLFFLSAKDAPLPLRAPAAQIRRAGFPSPTPIQAQAWPVAMSGRDLVAIAKTGSGKTCAFLIPGMLHIKATRKDPRMGPTLLVLAPTRELANQIKTEADKFGRSSGLRNT